MKKLYKTIVVFALLVVLSACNEDEFLTVEYKNGITDQSFLTSPVHAEQAVTGIYDCLGFQGVFNWTRIILGSSAADDIVEDHGDPGWPDLINVDKYRWTPQNIHIWDHWTDNYVGIGRANQVITKVPELKGLEAGLANRYVAEAKALRALYYYNLVTVHGDVPLITVPVSYEQSKNLTRNPETEVWSQIIKDLVEAKDQLPDSYGAGELGRVTKGFANGMLSRVYLWTKEYEKAAAAALAVINSPAGYQLQTGYADLFNGVANESKESVLAVMNAAEMPEGSIWARQRDETNRNYLWGPYFSWSWFIQPSRDFIDKDIEAGDVRVDISTLDSKKNETYDINNDGIIDVNDAIPSSPPGDVHLMKYVPANTDLTSGTVWSGGLGWVHVHIFRYAEVLLNYAEAMVEQGRPNEALPYINKIRNRGGLGNIITTDKKQLQDIILHERKVEFCFEGMRFFDLKRVGRLKEFLGPLGWTDKNVVFPIPQEEIDLTMMQQSDGY